MFSSVLLNMPTRAIVAKVEAKESKIIATSAAPPAAVWDARYQSEPHHTNDYYMKCVMGGIISCGLTHTIVCPLDVAKCNMQVRKLRLLYRV